MRRLLSRRTMLRASGAAVALPWLEAMAPAAAREREAPRRMVAICTNLGLLEKQFFPAETGAEFTWTPYLEPLRFLKGRLSVFSGLSHPDVGGGHSAEDSFLTAAPHPGSASFRNAISLDQYAAERIGHLTRVPTLSLCVAQKGNPSLSWTAGGVMLPAERRPSDVFRSLFIEGDRGTVETQIRQLRVGRSILDAVAERAASLQKKLGAADRERLDQYSESVREVERRLLAAEEWERRPKPRVDVPPPAEGEYLLEKLEAMFDLIRLALSTDSTRLVTLLIRLDGFGAHVPGVSEEAHNLSHHVGRPEKIEQLTRLELAQLRSLAAFLGRLHAVQEDESSLLDRTMVLYGSNLGNGNNHDNKNLPILLAGGGFAHPGHLAFDRQRNAPLANLFVSMLRRLGIAADRFASGTGPLKGLEA